ncbi:hypothetical protein [Clostridium sp.]|uniref:hypothetical protein n=1 Tax=Clostridium sp. TaxID=1506 RepID=UPI00399555B6
MINEFFKWLGKVTITSLAGLSYWICLFVAIGGTLAFICGFKKAGKYSTFSICIYSILQAFASALK